MTEDSHNVSGSTVSSKLDKAGTNSNSSSSSASYPLNSTAVYRHHSNEKKKMAASPPPLTSQNTELLTQKAILEQMFLKRPEEGDFWYVIVAEWLEQLKRYLGLPGTRKFYHNRSYPGPIITRRDYAHTVDVVHEDAWRMLVQWYGLADGHKPVKLIAYGYNRSPDIEHNLNTFKLSLIDSPVEDFHNVKFSKMEKVGHVEWRIREMYNIDKSKTTRLWGKPDVDGDWKLLLCRDKAIGKALGIDSDFIRPIIVLETCLENGKWNQNLDHCERADESPVGPFYEQDIFDDVTSTWEIDIHDQIDHIGKGMVDNLHMNFSAFVQKAKEFIDQRDLQLRQRERDISAREMYLDQIKSKLDEKEKTLDSDLESCKSIAQDYENKKEELEKEHNRKMQSMEDKDQARRNEVEKLRHGIEEEKDKFYSELQKMGELYKIQEGRIKLDIGGVLYTTSLATLNRDPDSMLSAMFSGRHNLKIESDGSYFIDRDGAHFRYILNYLRDGGIKDGTLPNNENLWRELLTEAEFYQVAGLVQYLKSLLHCDEFYSIEDKESDENDTFV